MKTNEHNNKPIITTELLTLATRSTQNALKSLSHNDSFIEDLLKQMHRDETALNELNRHHRTTATTNALAKLEELQDELKEHRKAQNRKSTPKKLKVVHAKAVSTLSYRCTDLRGYMRDINKADSNTISDRHDCVQTWLITYLYEEPSEKVIRNTVAKLWEQYNGLYLAMLTDYTIADIYNLAKIRNAKNAVCRYVRKQGGLNALDTQKTQAITPTKAEVMQWLNSHALWERYPLKGTTTRALELDKDGKPVFIDRYYTYKKSVTIETTDEDGNTIYRHSNNVAIHNRQDLDTFNALSQCEQFTLRERRFIRLLLSKDAIQAGAKARASYYSATDNNAQRTYETKEFQKACDDAETKGIFEHCYKALGIETDNAQRQFKSRLNRKLEKLPQIDPNSTHDTATAEELNHSSLVYMMESNHGTKGEHVAKSADLLNWTNNAPRRNTDAVAWLTRAEHLAQLEQEQEDKARKWRVADPDRATAERNAQEPHRMNFETVNRKHEPIEREELQAELAKAEQWANRYPQKATAPQEPPQHKAVTYHHIYKLKSNK